MTNILTIGFISEGTTDQRFLSNIIMRTFENLAFECKNEIEVYEPVIIHKQGTTFVDQVLKACEDSSWLNILCVHTDSDHISDKSVLENKINPTLDKINSSTKNICKNVVFLIPIQMTEAWMLADINLLIEEIGTNKKINELGLPTNINQIESVSDPKEQIINLIRLALSDQKSRKNSIKISDLYSPISQKISLSDLEKLSSYKKFKDNCIDSLKKIGYI